MSHLKLREGNLWLSWIRAEAVNQHCCISSDYLIYQRLARSFPMERISLLPELSALENVYLPAIALGRNEDDYLTILMVKI